MFTPVTRRPPLTLTKVTGESVTIPLADVLYFQRHTDGTTALRMRGNTVIVGRGELPAGYTLDATFVGSVPCFGGTGRIVATKSGQVTATCPSRG